MKIRIQRDDLTCKYDLDESQFFQRWLSTNCITMENELLNEYIQFEGDEDELNELCQLMDTDEDYDDYQYNIVQLYKVVLESTDINNSLFIEFRKENNILYHDLEIRSLQDNGEYLFIGTEDSLNKMYKDIYNDESLRNCSVKII